MNWQIFSTIGYLGIALAVAAVAAWLVHWKRPLRWLPAAGLALAVAATIAARVNSKHHVNRITIDPSARIAEAKALEAKKRQLLVDSRSDEVAQIQFAEDGSNEHLDQAGMDEVDLKYLKAISEGDTPEWKQRKQTRGAANTTDDSLESRIGGEEKSEGADVSAIEEATEEAPPILMSEAHVVLANRLDLWNLRATQWLVWAAIAVLVLDYLRRANRYPDATWPLPLPSTLLEAFTPLPVVNRRPQPPRRDTTAELAWLTRRGDTWILMTDKPATDIPAALAPLKRWPYRLDIQHVDAAPSDDFIFEAAWYGRSSFIADSPESIQRLLDSFIARLGQRRKTRARTTRNVHLVWDCATPVPPATLDTFHHVAQGTGVSLMVLHTPIQPT